MLRCLERVQELKIEPHWREDITTEEWRKPALTLRRLTLEFAYIEDKMFSGFAPNLQSIALDHCRFRSSPRALPLSAQLKDLSIGVDDPGTVSVHELLSAFTRTANLESLSLLADLDNPGHRELKTVTLPG